jgi:hypothetical protein
LSGWSWTSWENPKAPSGGDLRRSLRGTRAPRARERVARPPADLLGIATRTGALVVFAAGFLAVADTFTHTGQIAMLRRLAGSPVRGESYFRSDIAVGRVGQDQSAPHREFD